MITQKRIWSKYQCRIEKCARKWLKVFVSSNNRNFYNSGEPVYCYEGDTNNFNKSIVVGNANTNLGVLTTLANAGPNNIDAYKFVPNTTSGIHNVYYGWAVDTGETYTKLK